MQAQTDRLSIRIDANLKMETETILKRIGLSSGEAVRMFFSQITLHQGLPFMPRIPNAETKAAMAELERPQELKKYTSNEEFYKELGI